MRMQDASRRRSGEIGDETRRSRRFAVQREYVAPYRFSHRFKTRMGVSPTAFRAARDLQNG